ncbi:MAG: tRNA pseudouridine(38-40) synthase TruA, partial [Saprospiraceae bacterium]
AWYFSRHERLDLEKMQGVANLLPRYPAFSPFCKSHSGVDTYDCDVRSAYWAFSADRQQLIFSISANRFLRGMVRLIVGACLQVGLGKLHVEDVEIALEKQQALKKNLSVPPMGLFLTNVQYPYPVVAAAITSLHQ